MRCQHSPQVQQELDALYDRLATIFAEAGKQQVQMPQQLQARLASNLAAGPLGNCRLLQRLACALVLLPSGIAGSSRRRSDCAVAAQLSTIAEALCSCQLMCAQADPPFDCNR